MFEHVYIYIYTLEYIHIYMFVQYIFPQKETPLDLPWRNVRKVNKSLSFGFRDQHNLRSINMGCFFLKGKPQWISWLPSK